MWWYEYRNQVAKEMKERGEFEWGKERIYFDISLNDMNKIRDISMDIASTEKLPIAFKYLDTEKTYDVQNDENATRFVANFSSQEDAIKFYLALRDNEDYQKLIADRNVSYGGNRLDNLAEYANGYRENIDALQRIMNGHINKDAQWEWEVEGVKKRIPIEQYEEFKQQFSKFEDKLRNIQDIWDNALKDNTNA